MTRPREARPRAVAIAAGLALAAIAGAADAQTIGRLFTTVEERARLDQIRNDPDFGKEPEPAPEPMVIVDEPDKGPVVPAVTINGVVLRSSGNHVSWINGSQIASGEQTAEGIRVDAGGLADGRVRLRLPGGSETIQLKPGQKIDMRTGKLLESYEIRAQEGAASAFETLGGDAGAPPAPDAGSAAAPETGGGDGAGAVEAPAAERRAPVDPS